MVKKTKDVLSLEKEITLKEIELDKLRQEYDDLTDGRDHEIEKKFLLDYKAFKKEYAPHVAAIKQARKEIAALANKAKMLASYEDDSIVFSYVPKGFCKANKKLSEDFLCDFAADERIEFDALSGYSYGWTSSYL